MVQNTLIIPLLGSYLQIQVKFDRTRNDRLFPSSDNVELFWSYRLIYKNEVDVNLKRFSKLQNYINNLSEITTNYSRKDGTVELRELDFQWFETCLNDQERDILLKFDQNNLENNFHQYEDWLLTNMNLTSTEITFILTEYFYTSKFLDYLLIKFIGLIFLQIVDYYCIGYDVGNKLNPSISDGKTMVLDKSQVCHEKCYKESIIKLLEKISYLPSRLSRKRRSLFMLDFSDNNKVYAKRDTIIAAASNFSNFAYWKVININQNVGLFDCIIPIDILSRC